MITLRTFLNTTKASIYRSVLRVIANFVPFFGSCKYLLATPLGWALYNILFECVLWLPLENVSLSSRSIIILTYCRLCSIHWLLQINTTRRTLLILTLKLNSSVMIHQKMLIFNWELFSVVAKWIEYYLVTPLGQTYVWQTSLKRLLDIGMYYGCLQRMCPY